MRSVLVLSSVLFLGAALCACASSAARYSRDAGPCQCRVTMGGKCLCLHCAGEPGARCYCGTGGCGCGATMPKCDCDHCTGIAGVTACPCGAEAHDHGDHRHGK